MYSRNSLLSDQAEALINKKAHRKNRRGEIIQQKFEMQARIC